MCILGKSRRSRRRAGSSFSDVYLKTVKKNKSKPSRSFLFNRANLLSGNKNGTRKGGGGGKEKINKKKMRCICPRRYPYGNQIEILTCLCTHITAVVYTRGRGTRWTEGRADGHLIITHTQKVWVTLDAGCAATNEGRYVDTKFRRVAFTFLPAYVEADFFVFSVVKERKEKK